MGTNNIFAQFSSSLDSYGNFIDYPVVSGSVFNEQYNETLDSATIVLSQIPKEKRLSYIKQYDFVRVYDKSGNTGLDNVYLLDSFTETENNINEHIFGYTINLMSQTKLLEKIQCPNLAITHDVESGEISKKTIYQHIKQYMELYVPKIKFTSDHIHWSYEPLIKMASGNEHNESGFFNGINEDYFVAQGDDYEVVIRKNISEFTDIDINSIDLESVQTSNVVSDGNIPFYELEVWFDTTTSEFVFDGVVRLIEPDSSWHADISFDFSFFDSAFIKRFNVPCADLPFNAPTLRQLLTSLMMQVGCIPVVKNRVLGYLDFQLEAQNFNNGEYTVGNTVNKITRGASSDSYVNTLVNMSSQVLDSGNHVYSEVLAFRDRDNVLLKQTQNLFLETRFPIYKVESFSISSYVQAETTIRNIKETGDVGLPGSGESSDNFRWSFVHSYPSSNILRIYLGLTMAETGAWFRIQGKVVTFKFDGATTEHNISAIFTSNNFVPGVSDIFNIAIDSSDNLFYFYGTITVQDLAHIYSSYSYDFFYCNFTKNNKKILSLYSQNITPLLVESSVRANLSRNFVSGANQSTIDGMSKYVYGTLGYNIGSNRIAGFSDVFNVGKSTILGWINSQYTYIENIWTMITENYQTSIQTNVRTEFGSFPLIYDNQTPNLEFGDINPYNPIRKANSGVGKIPDFRWLYTNINFSYLWFNITYQPLNSFNLSYVKSNEDIDYTIAQYDGNESGLVDFDRLSIHEQEQVNRVGNETLTISQRATNISEIQSFDNGPLYYMDDTNRSGSVGNEDKGVKYVIFKKSFSIKNNCFNVSYTGSKDAILKNYFTSIRTKYRAYQYVDYSQSTLRKEKDIFYIKLSENGFYDGDDKLFFGSFTTYSLNNQKQNMVKLIFNSNSLYATAKNCILESDGIHTKNDLSIIANNNSVSYIYTEYDNVSSGLYIKNSSFSMSYDQKDFLIGGVPQDWQIWDDSYNTSHTVSFSEKININDIFSGYLEPSDATNEQIISAMNNILSIPIVSDELIENKIIFSVVDNNKSLNKTKRTFYKDGAEQINHTVQFIYYTDSENILWTEEMLKYGGDILPGYIIDLTNEEFAINNEMYKQLPENHTTVSASSIFSIVNNGIDNPYMQVNWNSPALNGITQFKVYIPIPARVGIAGYRDVVAFKKGDEAIQRFYITVNDTKSDYVLGEKNRILYRARKVKTYKAGDTIDGERLTVRIPTNIEEDN